jgi:hypothetical protein
MRVVMLLLICGCMQFALPAAEAVPAQGAIPSGAAGGPAIAYDVAVPSGSGPFSMIVALHGINGNEHQLLGSIRSGLDQAGFTNRYILLGLKSLGAGWEDVDHARIRTAITWACEQWPIDQRRIAGWGYSHGAFRLGVFGHQAQTLFAGVVLLSGGVVPVRDADTAQPTLPWYLIHGDADATVNVERGRSGADTLRKAGYSVVYREIIGEGHGTAGSAAAAPYRLDAIRWLDRLRCAASEPQGKAKDFLDDLQAKLVAEKKVKAASVLPGLLSINGTAIAPCIEAFLADESAANSGAAAKACADIALTETEIAGLVNLVKMGKGPVRDLAAQALGWSAHWGVPAAAVALADLVNDHESATDVRVAAIEGLGIGVPVQAPLANPDPALFTPLIAALTDDDAKVRLAAIVALVAGKLDPKASPDSREGAFGYRPQADAAERAAAQSRWQAWLAKHT